jgi:hypothetical protein
MVIADVSDLNPNVFYELAVRNAAKKPVVVVKRVDQKFPFDILNKRAVSLDMDNNRQWVDAKRKLKEYITNAESNPSAASESILMDFNFELLSKGQNVGDGLTFQIKDLIDEVYALTEYIHSDRFRISKSGSSLVEPIFLKPSSNQSIPVK